MLIESAKNKEIVGRAELKLAGAARAFGFDFRGKVVLDVGSSTGGFTEFALRNGAKKVVAVERGTNQMKAPLRFDPRVELHEKTDIKNVFLGDGLGNFIRVADLENQNVIPLGASGAGRDIHFDFPNLEYATRMRFSSPHQRNAFDVCLFDVSFTSVRPILAHVKKYLAGRGTEFLVMLKPQFEARAEQLKRGVVKNEKMRREIIKDFEQWLKRNDFVIVSKRDNDVAGKNGNRERFYYLKISSACVKI